MVSGISGNFFEYPSQDVQNRAQQFQQEFQQLGQDLQSGNLSAAQSDFATLQQVGAPSSSQSQNPIAQDFSQLAQDLQSGNVSAAQQDYSKIQQDMQSQQAQHLHGRHHHHHSDGDQAGTLSQLFAQLGQALQSGNLSAAQQTYSTLQQDLQQLGQSSAPVSASTPTASNTVSVNA
jgi:outer membrane protein assembly factor BamD (BamD/ComL family)